MNQVIILHLANHAASTEQTSIEAKTDIVTCVSELNQRALGVALGDTVCDQDIEENVTFVTIEHPSADWLKAIPGSATVEAVKFHVKAIIRDRIEAMRKQNPKAVICLWYEGVSTVAQLFDRYCKNVYMVKAHSERVVTEKGPNSKVSTFEHRRFWVI